MWEFIKRKNKRIYFDNASALPVLPDAINKFVEISKTIFANSSSIHFEGEKAKEILFIARTKIARCLHAKSNDVYFASSTTEANNIFIKGIVLQSFSEGKNSHIIYSKSDHSSIVEPVEDCKMFTCEVTSIVPNKIGQINIENILKEIRPDTTLICFSYVHSELGTKQEVRKIVQAVREHCDKNGFTWPKIFIDATQAVKYESIDVGNLLVDGMSFGASKIGGVSGCAVLYVRNGTKLKSIISGGGQEEGIRAGTENLASIVSLSLILPKVTNPEIQKNEKKSVTELKNYLIESLEKNFRTSDVRNNELEIFGDTKYKHNSYYEKSSPHILLITLSDILGEETLLRLDAKGISVSTASACSLLENSGSNFLKSINEPIKAKETIRISLSSTNTKNEIDYFIECLKEIKKYTKK